MCRTSDTNPDSGSDSASGSGSGSGGDFTAGRPFSPIRWIFSSNHKDIGTLYLVFAIAAAVAGGCLSLLMRIELQDPGLQLLGFRGVPDDRIWNLWITAHALVMVFYVVMPALIGGFGNYFVPIMIGAPDMAFPRLNQIGFWLMAPSLLLLIGAVFTGIDEIRAGFGPDRAWASGPVLNLLVIALHLAGVSSILGAVNYITTILNLRMPGMTLLRMPLFAWAILITAFLLLLAVPVLAGAITLLLTDRALMTESLAKAAGGDPRLYQNLFWFLGHPEVYIMILPAFGIVSQVVATFSRRPVFAYPAMVSAMVAIGMAGFVVWAHHLYTVGLSVDSRAYFMAATLIIAVPTGFQMLAWIMTMWGAPIRFDTPMLWALGFLFLFTMGGVTGMALSDGPGDPGRSDTYTVVAHFHYTLSLGAISAMFAGFFYWIGRMSGRQYPERWGRIHFWIMFLGVNLTVLPMHFLGQAGLARRDPDYSEAFAGWHFISSIGAYLTVLGGLMFLALAGYTLLYGRKVEGNYWGDGATTLEWTSREWTMGSPPFRFDETEAAVPVLEETRVGKGEGRGSDQGS